MPDKPTSKLMTPAEVAMTFRVDPKTVTRWAVAGRLTAIRTLGGHRRYDAAEIRALIDGTPAEEPPAVEPTAALLTPAEVHDAIEDPDSLHYLSEAEVRLAFHWLAGREPEVAAEAVARRLTERTNAAAVAS